MITNIEKTIGKAVDDLYNLDIRLSNAYTGVASSEHDQALVIIRKALKNGLDALSADNWIGVVVHLPVEKELTLEEKKEVAVEEWRQAVKVAREAGKVVIGAQWAIDAALMAEAREVAKGEIVELQCDKVLSKKVAPYERAHADLVAECDREALAAVALAERKLADDCETTPDYWDCDCQRDFIHPRSKFRCAYCNAYRKNQPDSRVTEVGAMLAKRVV